MAIQSPLLGGVTYVVVEAADAVDVDAQDLLGHADRFARIAREFAPVALCVGFVAVLPGDLDLFDGVTGAVKEV